MLRPTMEQRREIVAAMRAEGMSTRAIGSALGTSERTVRNDLRYSGAQDYAPTPTTGMDGKTYTPRSTEPEIVDDPETGGGEVAERGLDILQWQPDAGHAHPAAPLSVTPPAATFAIVEVGGDLVEHAVEAFDGVAESVAGGDEWPSADDDDAIRGDGEPCRATN